MGGFLPIVAFVFETGLLPGLVVPGGESLLFTAGLLVSTKTLQVNIITLLFVLCLPPLPAKFQALYRKKVQRWALPQKDTWYFKKKYLEMAEKYIEKHKRMALIFGKFLPIIRPFSPVISGTHGFRWPDLFRLH